MAKEATARYSEGRYMPYTPGSAVAAGQVVPLVNMIGVATEDIAASVAGTLDTEGVYQMAAETGVAWNQGDKLYWDDTANRLTKTATDNTPAGLAFAPKDAAAAIGYVKLGFGM